jgi:hypothetical protein
MQSWDFGLRISSTAFFLLPLFPCEKNIYSLSASLVGRPNGMLLSETIQKRASP